MKELPAIEVASISKLRQIFPPSMIFAGRARIENRHWVRWRKRWTDRNNNHLRIFTICRT